MADNVLDHLKKLKGVEPIDDDEQVTDYGIVGWLRGTKDRALYLDCILKTGNSIAFSYGLLEQVVFDPSEGITLVFMGRKVAIRGIQLDKSIHGSATLKDGFLRHRIPWIRESSKEGIMASKEAVTQITQIQVE